MHGEDEDGQPRTDPLQILHQVDTVSITQGKIEYHHIPVALLGQFQCGMARFGFPEENSAIVASVEQSLYTVSNDSMIVHKKNSCHASDHTALRQGNRYTSTAIPNTYSTLFKVLRTR